MMNGMHAHAVQTRLHALFIVHVLCHISAFHIFMEMFSFCMHMCVNPHQIML